MCPAQSHQVAWIYECPSSVISVDTDSTCSIVVAAAVDCSVHAMDHDGQLLWTRELDAEGWSVAISADGTTVAVGTAQKRPAAGSVFLFRRDGTPLDVFTIGAPVWALDVSPDGRRVLVSSWDNSIRAFELDGEHYQQRHKRSLGSKGLYGVWAPRDSTGTCFVASYEDGIYELNADLKTKRKYRVDDGLYGVAGTPEARCVAAGCRCGSFWLRRRSGEIFVSPKISDRPVCGVSISDDGDVLALGSFDGSVYLSTADGRRVWRHQLQGEVWSTAMSSDASSVVVGSGDATVTMLRNACTSGAMGALVSSESLAEALDAGELRTWFEGVKAEYVRLGICEYGVQRIREICAVGHVEPYSFVEELLAEEVRARPGNSHAQFVLGSELLESAQRRELKADRKSALTEAIRSLQLSASDPAFALRSLLLQGEAFKLLGMHWAAVSCFRRARQQHLSRHAQSILYNLARSYEDSGLSDEAARNYETLMAWNIDYRNALERYVNLDSGAIGGDTEEEKRKDYTGFTVSMLGPDVPRESEVDNSMLPVLSARQRELHEDAGERAMILSAIDAMELGKPDQNSALGYDLLSYMKYDYLLPEDQVKKHLEMVNTLSLVLKDSQIEKSLDIGTATGRYPLQLSSMGIRAYGVDIEREGIDYAKRKAGDREYPKFTCADILDFESDPGSFDLVTCMMGTFAHLPEANRSPIFEKVRRFLRPGGLLIVSTWDVECPHLSFLSMYSYTQKELIASNSLTRDSARRFFESLDYQVLEMRPVVLLPDVFAYDLGRDGMNREDVQRMAEIDMAAAGLFPDMHGEMYIVVARARDSR